MSTESEVNPVNIRLSRSLSALISAGRFFHQRGWVPATSSNFSARIDATSMLVTVSGRHKGELVPGDFMRMDVRTNESMEPDRRPSAEAALHSLMYRLDSAIGSVLHVHSPNSTVLSRGVERVYLEDYELLKAFKGIDTHATGVELPVFANDQDIDRLAGKVEAYLDERPETVAYLIAGHGIYTWGETVQQTVRYIEALEFLLECEYRRLTLAGSAPTPPRPS
ncbi:MAG: methylthioribulose 1-phosphate dehydratase [Thiotrichales bacterium]